MKRFGPHKLFLGFTISLAAILLLLVATLVVIPATIMPAQAAPTDDLPPRPPTPTPDVPAPAPIEPTPIPPVQGAYIILDVPDGNGQLWTVVQWLDLEGAWHDVDGWRGHLDDGEGKMKIWWVAPEDFGTGTMRWQVYDGPEGRLRATSDPFSLPGGSDEAVHVSVELAP